MGDISKNFSRHEFKCGCGCGFATADVELIKVLEDVRNFFNSSITINSGSRCISHNHMEGGSTKSKHVQGMAADIVVKDMDSNTVYEYLDHQYKEKYGIGKYVGRTHIDVRKERVRWDKT